MCVVSAAVLLMEGNVCSRINYMRLISACYLSRVVIK